MTLEQSIKNLLGEYAFQIAYLQQQIVEKDAQIAELKKEENDSSRK